MSKHSQHMKHTFTQNDLVAYVYGEASPEQIAATEDALAADPALVTDLVRMVEAQAALPKISFHPRPRILNKIMDYARGKSDLRLCF